MTQIPTTGITDVDGRTARRDRNREAVLDAAVDLYREGVVAPNAAQIAERAGVSLRSVFRYFDDTDGLKRAAIDHHFARIAPFFEIADMTGTTEERIRRFVDARLDLFAAVRPTVHVTLAHARSDELIGERLQRARHLLRTQFETMFADELRQKPASSRRLCVAALDTLFQIEALDHMTVHLELTRPQIADALRRALRSLLA